MDNRQPKYFLRSLVSFAQVYWLKHSTKLALIGGVAWLFQHLLHGIGYYIPTDPWI